MSLNNTEPSQDEYKELREIIWYELGDGLNATDVDEACITIGKLIADRERQARIEAEIALLKKQQKKTPIHSKAWELNRLSIDNRNRKLKLIITTTTLTNQKDNEEE